MKNLKFWHVAVIALILRLLLIFLFYQSRSQDLDFFVHDGYQLFNRNIRYEADYFPFISYLGALSLVFKNIIPPHIFLKIIFALFDTAILWPLYSLAKKNFTTLLIYAFNPISIITFTIHGQMDSIPLFLFLEGLVFFQKKQRVKSIIALSIAMFTKQWPILFVLPIIKRSRNKFVYLLLILIPLVLTLAHAYLFHKNAVEIFTRIKNYRGVFGAWGISKIYLYLSDYTIYPSTESLLRKLFLLAYLIFVLFYKNKNIYKEILMTMLFLFIFTPTFGLQWLTWFTPFLLIVKPKLWRTLLILVSVYVAFGFAWDAIPFFKNIMPLWNAVITRVGIIVWITMIVMFCRATPLSD